MFDGELLSRKRKHNRHSECFRPHENVRNVCRDCFLCRRLCARHGSSTVQERYQRRSFVYEYYTPDGEEKSSKYIQMDRSERKIKQTVSHNAETADRDRVKNKETSNYTRKYAAPLARSSFTFGNLFAVKIIGAEERKVKRVFRGEESAALSGNKHIPDLDKKRADIWLMQLRVQFPSRQPPYGSIRNITYAKEGVKIAGGKRKSPTHTASTQPLWPDPLPYSGISKKQNPDPFKARP